MLGLSFLFLALQPTKKNRVAKGAAVPYPILIQTEIVSAESSHTTKQNVAIRKIPPIIW